MVLVVLDAIDECEGEFKVKKLLQTLLKTSMPENFLFFLRVDRRPIFGPLFVRSTRRSMLVPA